MSRSLSTGLSEDEPFAVCSWFDKLTTSDLYRSTAEPFISW
jgi:hypothetical protein